jgi:hypothetical protein
MRSLARSGFWKTGLLATLALIGLVFAWITDHRSPERANRLYRAGALQEAAALYADRLARNAASAQLRYNLGTALLGLRNEKAREELSQVSAAADDEIEARALYNLGLWHLTEALNAESIASATAHATSAVEENKRVLRLQPARADASWNLAIALRLLASIDAEQHLGAKVSGARATARDRAAVPTVAGDGTRLEDSPDAPRAAEKERTVRVGDVTVLSVSAASEIIGTRYRDPTMMVRKLMAFEGRKLRLRTGAASMDRVREREKSLGTRRPICRGT